MSSNAAWEAPPALVRRWVQLHGHDAVRRWLADARVLAERCEQEWQVRVDGFLPGGSLSCVLACRSADGDAAVLKLLAPWADEAIGTEALALSAWNGHGAAELLAHTPDGRALLMRRVRPGSPFVPSRSDERDCERVAETLRALASAPVPPDLPTLSTVVRARFARARGMAVRHGLIAAKDLDHAERRAVTLARSVEPSVLVHGDVQDKNLLVAEGSMLVAIDPEPSVGDRHFDPALWALTHRPGDGVRERCRTLSELLDLDAARMWQWCLVLLVAEVALEREARALAHHELLERVGTRDR